MGRREGGREVPSWEKEGACRRMKIDCVGYKRREVGGDGGVKDGGGGGRLFAAAERQKPSALAAAGRGSRLAKK